mmetsp:Transcript_63724/g.105217  ORF Transcript_63724/g.105217 Transcript_63724/m.105217 type:complete len:260 (-) Transcript_63724:2329-3108(-)
MHVDDGHPALAPLLIAHQHPLNPIRSAAGGYHTPIHPDRLRRHHRARLRCRHRARSSLRSSLHTLSIGGSQRRLICIGLGSSPMLTFAHVDFVLLNDAFMRLVRRRRSRNTASRIQTFIDMLAQFLHSGIGENCHRRDFQVKSGPHVMNQLTKGQRVKISLQNIGIRTDPRSVSTQDTLHCHRNLRKDSSQRPLAGSGVRLGLMEVLAHLPFLLLDHCLLLLTLTSAGPSRPIAFHLLRCLPLERHHMLHQSSGKGRLQ